MVTCGGCDTAMLRTPALAATAITVQRATGRGRQHVPAETVYLCETCWSAYRTIDPEYTAAMDARWRTPATAEGE